MSWWIVHSTRASSEAWPGSEEAAVRWLADRGGRADRDLDDVPMLSDVVLVGKQFGWRDRFLFTTLTGAIGGRRALRGTRTTSTRIGRLPADLARELDFHQVYRPVLRTTLLIALVVFGGVFAGVYPVQFAVTALAVPFIGPRTPFGVVIALTAVPIGLVTWWFPVLCLLCTTTISFALPLYLFIRVPGADRGPYLGFLPRRVVITLALKGKLSMFMTAVDVSGGDNADMAVAFLDACGDVPVECEPVIAMCRATVAFHSGDLDGAITGAAKARTASTSDGVRGWCALHTASILLASGREGDARKGLGEAVGLLAGRRARRWSYTASIRRLELDLAVGELVEVLREVHRFRLRAIRVHDLDLVVRTEMWLARLALRHGESENVAWTLNCIVSGTDGRGNVVQTRDDTAAELLLRASVTLSNPDAAERVRADADAALALVDARKRPLAAVNARLVLAKLAESQGKSDEALGHAAEALSVANRARYQLPSGRWRAQWSLHQLDVFATTLRLADAAGESELVAEVLEAARGEVLPADVPAADAGLLGLLEQFSETDVVELGKQGAPRDLDAALTIAGFSPVTRPSVARVAGSKRIPLDDDVETFDLDRRLVATAGRCWYWSAVTVADRHYWAVRAPDGRWTHGWVDQSPGSRAATVLTALGLALPMEQEGERHEDVAARVLDGPLGRPDDPTRELRLLADVAEALVPDALRHGLLGDMAEDRKLVVSLPAALSHLPVAWLPLSRDPDVRIVERAAVVHVPGWGVIARCLERPRLPIGSRWPTRAAIVNAGGAADITSLAAAPQGTRHVTTRPLSKKDVSHILDALSDRRDWLLYLVGHMAGEPGNAGLHGLEVSGEGLGGVLTIRDLVGRENDGTPRFRVPSRIVIVGCDSMGMSTSVSGDTGGAALANEWLGFSAAVMLAGADDVCCTAYPVYENQTFLRLAHLLALRLSDAPDAGLAVAEVQRDRLRRWRATGAGLPVLWQSFVYIGRG